MNFIQQTEQRLLIINQLPTSTVCFNTETILQNITQYIYEHILEQLPLFSGHICGNIT